MSQEDKLDGRIFGIVNRKEKTHLILILGSLISVWLILTYIYHTGAYETWGAFRSFGLFADPVWAPFTSLIIITLLAGFIARITFDIRWQLVNSPVARYMLFVLPLFFAWLTIPGQ